MAKSPNDPEAEQAMYASIGQALTAWGRVEFELSRVYATTVGENFPSDPAAAAFWEVVSFDARLKTVNVAVDRAVHRESLAAEQWLSLSTRCRKRNRRRNALAHGSVIYTMPPKRILAFAPFFWSAMTQRRPFEVENNLLVYTQNHICAFTEAFTKLASDLRAFQPELMIGRSELYGEPRSGRLRKRNARPPQEGQTQADE